MKRDCRRLQNKTQKTYSTHIASTNDTSEKSVLISVDEFVKFSEYQESLKSSSTHVPTIAESGKLNTCLISSYGSLILLP